MLEQPFRDVFIVVGRHSALTGDWAGLLAAGTTAVLAAWSAARALQMAWPQRPHGPVCLALPPDEHRRLTGVVVLRHGLRACDILTAPGRPATTTRPRTVVDCLRLAPRTLRAQMLDEALYQRWLSVDDLVDQVHAVHGQHGAPALRELLRGVASGARSAAERLAQKVLGRSGIDGWRWNHPVALPDGTTAVADAALPELRIAVEIDGRAYHSGPREFQHFGPGHWLLDVLGLQFRQPVEVPSGFWYTPRPIGVEPDRDRRSDGVPHGPQDFKIDIEALSRAEFRLDRPDSPSVRSDGRLDRGVCIGQRDQCVQRHGPVCSDPGR
jgi:hypothetical protein